MSITISYPSTQFQELYGPFVNLRAHLPPKDNSPQQKKPQDICTKIRVCGKNSAFKEKIMKIDPSQHICQTCVCVLKFSH